MTLTSPRWPGRQQAAVEQADRLGRRPGLLVHEQLDRQAAVRAVAAPPLQQRRREADVADRADVGAAVGQPDDRRRVGELLADGVERAVDVVQRRQVQHRPAVVCPSITS